MILAPALDRAVRQLNLCYKVYQTLRNSHVLSVILTMVLDVVIVRKKNIFLGITLFARGVTACHPIPWVGGDNRILEDQHLSGGAAWPSGFAASQGTPS